MLAKLFNPVGVYLRTMVITIKTSPQQQKKDEVYANKNYTNTQSNNNKYNHRDKKLQ